MRRIKRFVALGMGILMFAASACGSKTYGDTKEETSVEKSIKDNKNQPEDIESEAERAVNEEKFDEMMQALEQYEEGSAGASLKRWKAVFGVLNFSEQYESMQKEDLMQKIADYLGESDETDEEILKRKLDGINPTVYTVFSDGVESVKDELEDAGNPNQYETYNQEKYEEVISVFEETLG